MPKVSILMNCYNSDRYLRESIDSVINQTFSDWEIIFWDNQSTDNSAKIAQSYNDKRIKYYYAPAHTSLYQGRSCALKLCVGEYLAFLDCDDLWADEKLEKQINVFENNKDIVLVHSNTLFFNSDTGSERIFNKKSRISGYIFKENLLDYQFSLETVMVRMQTISVNGIDFGDFNMIGERDFFSMVCFYGDVFYIDEVLGKWRIHNNNFSKVLHNSYPKELKLMYSRFKKRFKSDFTREMRLTIHHEIIFRESLNAFQTSGTLVRKKLKKLPIFNMKGVVLKLISYFPKKMALDILNLLKRA